GPVTYNTCPIDTDHASLIKGDITSSEKNRRRIRRVRFELNSNVWTNDDLAEVVNMVRRFAQGHSYDAAHSTIPCNDCTWRRQSGSRIEVAISSGAAAIECLR